MTKAIVESVVSPENWFSALSGERRMAGKRMVEFGYACRNTLSITAWGNNYRVLRHEWHPASHAYFNSLVGELSGVHDSLIGATQLLSPDVS